MPCTMSRTSGSGSVLHQGYADLLAYTEYVLTDVVPDDGPFVVIPDSHKANFAHPYAD